MRRAVLVLATVALTLCLVAAPAAAWVVQPGATPVRAQQDTDGGDDADGATVENETSPDGNGTGNGSDISPGEHFVGVVGVQQAELEGEVENRTFGVRVARAATDNAKADVVKSQLDAIERRLVELRNRKESLAQARENHTISEGRYRAEIASLAARTQTVQLLANESENTSKALPSELLESKGINVTAIQTLRENASALTGPEVAAIARTIAGPGTNAFARGPPADRGSGGAPAAANRTGPPGSASGSQPAAASNRTQGNASAAEDRGSGQGGSQSAKGQQGGQGQGQGKGSGAQSALLPTAVDPAGGGWP